MTRGGHREWGRHIRSSPQSNSELLQELREFFLPWDVFSEVEGMEGFEPVEFYDVVQWLEVSCHALLAMSHSFAEIPRSSNRLD
jgi:hypothetical protein